MIDNFNLSRSQRINIIRQQDNWDIIIIGGGITGAGILKLASQLGLRALLVEQRDFSWGSSSRSSKMVHGGLRYIADGQIKLTVESVKERQHLVEHSNGLVFNQSFLMSHYKKQFPQPWIFNSLLSVYDFIAGIKQHNYLPKAQYSYYVPKVKTKYSKGGSQFVDAMTDDCRLVLRLLQEAQTDNNKTLAINYTKVTKVNYQHNGVKGVQVQLDGQNIPIKSKVVINATGAQASQFNLSKPIVKLRALRGSHLVVSNWSLPVASAISVRHPKDKRPVQIYPWQNTTIVGTTDVEHKYDLNVEPNISQNEFDYLIECVKHQFEGIKLNDLDLISTFSGVRPVVTKGGGIDPSKEKRDHSIWHEKGVINIAGGKLTTLILLVVN
ncbi:MULTISPECIES: glycerol-3-phosphate dehydrogenase/oxidase [unclassified Pseudoalteromonas]|uniref:glycerol-3-phosphate dehydrogenase/oxidase n=1 Tax=unclassified Pseudoalteromonas TaxID=194690 RepID=UPI000694A07E|nr:MULTISPECIES: FAD-dependent oxidoreductase [unclassified Pseudoalteromonas]